MEAVLASDQSSLTCLHPTIILLNKMPLGLLWISELHQEKTIFSKALLQTSPSSGVNQSTSYMHCFLLKNKYDEPLVPSTGGC